MTSPLSGGLYSRSAKYYLRTWPRLPDKLFAFVAALPTQPMRQVLANPPSHATPQIRVATGFARPVSMQITKCLASFPQDDVALRP